MVLILYATFSSLEFDKMSVHVGEVVEALLRSNDTSIGETSSFFLGGIVRKREIWWKRGRRGGRDGDAEGRPGMSEGREDLQCVHAVFDKAGNSINLGELKLSWGELKFSWGELIYFAQLAAVRAVQLRGEPSNNSLACQSNGPNRH